MDGQAFIDAIVAAPGALDRWEVYADWLIERGEPRGELINLELAAEAGRSSNETERRIQELKLYDERLVSPRLLEQRRFWRLELRRGFLQRAALDDVVPEDEPTREAIMALFADPHAALLERLELLGAWDPALLDVVLETPRTVRQLVIGPVHRLDERFARALPALERLEIGMWTCEESGEACLTHPTLRELAVELDVCAAVCTGAHHLPGLERLVLNGDGQRPAFGPGSILAAPPPRLASIVFASPCVGIPYPEGEEDLPYIGEQLFEEEREDAFFRNLVAAPVAAQLRELEIEIAEVRALRRLATEAAAFPRLERLAVAHVRGELSADEIVELRAACEAAFPRVTIEVDWQWLGPLQVTPGPKRVFDADSRGPDGRIDAIGAFTSRRDGDA